MYHQNKNLPNLDEILRKVKKVPYGSSNPITYSTQDIVAARVVLKRLLENTNLNEVVSIKHVAVESNEV
jgi:hypothetical protein